MDLLGRLLERIEHYARTVDRQRLEHDLDTWLMVGRALELAARCCIDLATAVIAQRSLGLPDTYRETFARLAQAGLISSETAAALEGWAGLRNVLAHVYAELDLDRIHGAFHADLTPLRELGRIAAEELGSHHTPE